MHEYLLLYNIFWRWKIEKENEHFDKFNLIIFSLTPKVFPNACLNSVSMKVIFSSFTFTMAKDVSSDDEFNKHIASNKFVLAIFMESDTEMEVS